MDFTKLASFALLIVLWQEPSQASRKDGSTPPPNPCSAGLQDPPVPREKRKFIIDQAKVDAAMNEGGDAQKKAYAAQYPGFSSLFLLPPPNYRKGAPSLWAQWTIELAYRGLESALAETPKKVRVDVARAEFPDRREIQVSGDRDLVKKEILRLIHATRTAEFENAPNSTFDDSLLSSPSAPLSDKGFQERRRQIDLTAAYDSIAFLRGYYTVYPESWTADDHRFVRQATGHDFYDWARTQR
jgi:hypothetical protein